MRKSKLIYKEESILLSTLCDEQKDVRKSLTMLFSFNAAGVNWNSKYKNFKELVAFCIENCDPGAYLVNGPEIHHLTSNLSSIIKKIEKHMLECVDPLVREDYSVNMERAYSLLAKAKADSEHIYSLECFKLVDDCWEILDDWSITYRFLYDVASMTVFRDSRQIREELYEIVSRISKEWKE